MITPYETDYIFVGIVVSFTLLVIAIMLFKKEAVIPINKAIGFLFTGAFCLILQIANFYFIKGMNLEFIVSYLTFQRTTHDSFGRWGLTLFYMISLTGLLNIVANLASEKNQHNN